MPQVEGVLVQHIEQRGADVAETAAESFARDVLVKVDADLRVRADRSALERITPSSATGELYLTGIAELAAAQGNAAVLVVEPDESDWASELAGINDRSDLAELQLVLQLGIVQRHMEAGVTFHDPAEGPFRSLAAKEFERRWKGAGYWTLLVLPPQP